MQQLAFQCKRLHVTAALGPGSLDCFGHVDCTGKLPDWQFQTFEWRARKMAEKSLAGKRVAFLATDGFEQVELTEPWKAIQQAGAAVELISLETGEIQGMHHFEKGDMFPVDRKVTDVSSDDYDALVLPGGLANPDTLRMNPDAVAFAASFMQASKPVAAICHGPWLLVEADAVSGRTLTSWPSLRTDIENAGGQWVDEEVHCENGLVTSRRPDDLPAFCAKAIEEIAEGIHA
jgi:protease I